MESLRLAKSFCTSSDRKNLGGFACAYNVGPRSNEAKSFLMVSICSFAPLVFLSEILRIASSRRANNSIFESAEISSKTESDFTCRKPALVGRPVIFFANG